MTRLRGKEIKLARARLTQDALKEVLSYDPETGVFTWTGKATVKRWIGTAAGSPCKRGYTYIVLFRVRYLAHRLAWLYMTGKWPNPNPDHRDCDPGNNRWENLRLATQSQNRANSKKKKPNGLPKGVAKAGNRFVAHVSRGGKSRHVGSFRAPEEAQAAYIAAAKEAYGEFARPE
jgi:hypothetical protein